MTTGDVLIPLVVVGVLMLAGPGICLPSGAPTSACVSMRPGHGNQSTDPAPYRIYTNKDPWGESIRVIVDVLGDATYRGILMQMQEVGWAAPVGTWMNVANNTRTLSCRNPGDSVTHKNTMHKGRSVFTWRPPYPGSCTYKRLQVRATIASGFSTWWMNVVSDPIPLYPSGGLRLCSIPLSVLLMVAALSTALPLLSV